MSDFALSRVGAAMTALSLSHERPEIAAWIAEYLDESAGCARIHFVADELPDGWYDAILNGYERGYQAMRRDRPYSQHGTTYLP